MNITIWSDFVCPFCYIGGEHLLQALKNADELENAKIEFKSYQLEPGAKYEPDKTYIQAMVDRKGISEEQMRDMNNQVDQMAKQAGLNFNFDEMKLTDTYPAHRVFQYAKEEGKGVEFYNRLYKAFFINGELINDLDFLKKIAKELDLTVDRVEEIYHDKEAYDSQVQTDIYEASQIGIRGVPFFVFNDRLAVPGAQPVEVFENVFKELKELEDKDATEN